MLHHLPAVPPGPWLSQRGLFIQALDFNLPQSYALRSYAHKKCGLKQLPMGKGDFLRHILSYNQRWGQNEMANKQRVSPQNVDLPPVMPKNKKKPYPIPLKKILQAARDNRKLAEKGIETPLEPPKNGIVVSYLVPIAYEVFDAWKVLIKGIAQVLHFVPIYGCSECQEIYVGFTGHHIRNCSGPNNSKRRGLHSWIKGSINDILVPIESYHQYDPFGKRVKHHTRFDYDRIPAVVELCIQAGVEISEYPSCRRTRPIRMIGKKLIDLGEFDSEPSPRQSTESSSAVPDFDTHGLLAQGPPPQLSELPGIAQETIDAFEIVRKGVRKLMGKYSVKACGYCPEVHVGPWGHNVKLCGEFKHQWRDGKHGWQDATLDEVFPPNYVWHVRDPKGPPLRNELRKFYGQAPAVVELCMQAGARIPDHYKPMMRLDIVIPESDEARFVA